MSDALVCLICHEEIKENKERTFASSCCPRVIVHFECIKRWKERNRFAKCIVCRRVSLGRLKVREVTVFKSMNRRCKVCGQPGHYSNSPRCPGRLAAVSEC